VHCQFSGSATHTVAIAHELGLPSYSVGAHSVLHLFGGMQREKWRGAAFGTCITEALFADVAADLGDAQPPVWGIAPMGLDVDTYRRREPYEPHRGSGVFRLFSCGRLNPSKGHDVLIRAVGELRDRGRPVELHIGGADDRLDGSYRAELETLVRDLGLDREVTFLGAVRQDQVMAELEAAHAFALASWTEGAGVVIMEAMAFELPVVATDVGGVPEVVERDSEGLLVPAGDAAALADALEVVMDDPERAREMGRRGRAKIEQDFRAERSAELLVRLTADALRRP
jgi:glycosyltransferase involved in cell wall biosynthesis